MHFDTATRQRWMSVLAHSEPEELLARMQTLQLAPDYELIRCAGNRRHADCPTRQPQRRAHAAPDRGRYR